MYKDIAGDSHSITRDSYPDFARDKYIDITGESYSYIAWDNYKDITIIFSSSVPLGQFQLNPI